MIVNNNHFGNGNDDLEGEVGSNNGSMEMNVGQDPDSPNNFDIDDNGNNFMNEANNREGDNNVTDLD